jgi:archaellum component FlaC
MSEERFDQLDRELDAVTQRLNGVDRRLDGIDGRLDGIDGRLDVMDARFDRVENRMDRLETGQNDLREEMRAGFAELRNHMGVLFEEGITRLKAMPEGDVPTRGEMNDALRRATTVWRSTD